MNLKLLWYCTKSDLKLYKTRDDGSIAKFVNTERKDLERCLKN